MVSHVSDGVAGLSIPDTPPARHIAELVREAEHDLHFHDSCRVGLTVPYRSKCDIPRDEGEACAAKLTAAGVHSSPRHRAHGGRCCEQPT